MDVPEPPSAPGPGTDLAIRYQPIVDLRSGAIFAYEALCRPTGGRFTSPQEMIRSAVRDGSVGELGRLQREQAIRGCTDWPLFINLEPSEFDHGWLVRPDDPIFRHRRPVYLEITETVPLKFFHHCHSVLAEVRKKGALLAIDDLGAGFSNLKYISELKPEVVKLDRELVGGTRVGSSAFGLLKSITRLCHEMSAEVVAEGVETADELDAVLEAGIDYCQGFLLGRPADPPPPVEWPPELPPERLRQKTARVRARRGAGGGADPLPAEPPRPQPPARPSREEELRRQLRTTAKALAASKRTRRALDNRLAAASERVESLRRELEALRARVPSGGRSPGPRDRTGPS